jgi:hypothetical protein
MYSSTSLENQVFIVEEFIQLYQTEERVTTEIDNEIKYIHTCYARYRLRRNQLTQVIQQASCLGSRQGSIFG